MHPLHAIAAVESFASFSIPLRTSASEAIDAEVRVSRVFAANGAQRKIVDQQMVIVLDCIDDAQAAGARDEIDEMFDERFDFAAVADRVDDGETLRRRKIMRGRHRPRERDPRRIRQRGGAAKQQRRGEEDS